MAVIMAGMAARMAERVTNEVMVITVTAMVAMVMVVMREWQFLHYSAG